MRLALTLALGAGPIRAVAQSPATVPENEVKAAYLLNFTRYVDWPPSAFPTADSPVTICIVGRDPIGPAIDDVVRERRVHGRPIRVLRLAAPAPGGQCHVAFLAHEVPLADARSAWGGRPVLLVGEGARFAEAGGTIAFVPADETLRFEINAGAARASGIQISSRVMSLATRVYDAPRER